MTSTVTEAETVTQPDTSVDPLSVGCTQCGAEPNVTCASPGGRNAKPHAKRVKAAEHAASEPIRTGQPVTEPAVQPHLQTVPEQPQAPTLADVFPGSAGEEAPILVEVDTEDRLAQLHAAYADAKANADEASKHLKTITDGIKAELTARVPDGTERIELRGGDNRPLRLTYVESWRLDSTRLKAEDPLLYVRYAKKSGSWTLKPAGGAQ